MKKHYNFFRTLAALLIAGITFVSCTKDEEPGNDSKTYSVTINATKGGDNSSKQLDLDGNSISATWAVDEEVTVYKGSTPLGTLRATTAGTTTTLSGTLSGEIAVSDELTLKFCSPDYESQGGTLEYIAANCDYAEATVTVNDVSGGTLTTTDAAFVNKQAIVKFTLQNKSGSLPINATSLTIVIDDLGATYTVTPSSATNVFFVAIPATTSTIILTATTSGDTYTYMKTGVSFSNSQYYTVNVRMGKLVNLASLSTDYTAQDGDVLTGTLTSGCQIFVAADATITLRSATIVGLPLPDESEGISCSGNATIILERYDNYVTGTVDYPGISIPEGYTLTILGNGGGITATGDDGAGIGGGYGLNCGNIIIESGNISATSNSSCAIGGGANASCGHITINGGTIKATGGFMCAGIGCAVGDEVYGAASCGDITISGGDITATGGDYGAAIGSGLGEGFDDPELSGFSTCGNITITGGRSKRLEHGEDAVYTIGAGYKGACGTITIFGTPYSPGYTGSTFGY